MRIPERILSFTTRLVLVLIVGLAIRAEAPQTLDRSTPSRAELASCQVDTDCDDAVECTDDSCVSGSCVFTNDDTNVCSDGDACTNDACTNGVCGCPATTGACEGSPSVHVDSTDVPKSIPTTAPPNVVTSILTVDNVGDYLFDLDVRTFVTHTSSGQLQMTIRSPLGTIVTLTTGNGGTNDNVFNGTVWNDDADPGTIVPFPANTFAASKLVTDHVYTNNSVELTLVPEEALGAFIGEDPNGDWTLTIADTANGEGGNLANWSLDVSTLSDPPLETTASYASSDVPKTIATTGPPNVATSTLTVGSAGSQIGRVLVTMGLNHTWSGDLDITLTSPGLTTVTLTSDNGAGNDNVFNGTVWNATVDPSNQVPYVVPLAASKMVTDTQYVNLTAKTTLVSEESLAAFVGEDPNGVWTLKVSDDTNGDGGALNSWSLEIVTTTCVGGACDVECDDNNPCTDDTCVPPSGCVYTPNTAPCSDGALCTTNDVCVGGACAGEPTLCNDNNVCTDDICNPVNGQCLYINDNTNPCEDGDLCTVGDVCGVGPGPLLAENFDGVTAPALPAGWVSTHTPAPANPWTTTTALAVSAPNSATTDTPVAVSDKTLESPAFVARAGDVLQFDNRYNMEASVPTPTVGFDGAVLEIKIGSEAYTDIVTRGGSFNSGPYLHTISAGFGSPIPGRMAWSGASAGFVATSVNLPGDAAGQTVRLRWRVASDVSAAAPAPNGQWIDNVVITSLTATCQPGMPRSCDDGDQCTLDFCNPATGICEYPAAPEGTSCNDGNACTQTDRCESGSCTGTNPVVCVASDQCHLVGTCDEANGQCSNPVANNGTSCNDGDACTLTESCQNGTCTATTTVVCTALDACHVAGTCDTGTGICSNPTAADGTACSDGNVCTAGDSCRSGVCTSTATFHEAAVSPVGTGTLPRTVVAADFNLDGKDDLAVANQGSGDVTILLGNASGGFDEPLGNPFGAGPAPFAMTVDDFDDDDDLDLAVTSFSSGNVTILLGNGAGGFDPAASSPATPSRSISIATADFDLDDVPDLAVANLDTNDVSILLGDGSGGFADAPGSPVATGVSPAAVAVGDFDHDDTPDLAVASFASNDVMILLGNDDGTFTPFAGGPIGTAGMSPTFIAVGDVDGDDDADLAVVNQNSNDVTILLGDGAGGFAAASGSPIAVGISPRSAAMTDLNRDGRLDLAVANNNANDVTILLGDGTGRFGQPAGSPIGAELSSGSVAVGDFDRDGVPDLAVANSSSDSLTILLGEADAANDGTSCNDGDACTLNDACHGGVCAGPDRVICQDGDQCHLPGICNPATGLCSNPNVDNGTPCVDDDLCTQTDTCQSGVCTGANPVVCVASDQCHAAGVCKPQSGLCTNPNAVDGTACDDGNGCTSGEQCWAGVCAPPSASNAIAPGPFHTCAIRSDRRLACWGSDYLQAVSGPNGSTANHVAVSSGYSHTCAVRTDGRLACWGSDHRGQVSGPNGSTATYKAVAAGYMYTCALDVDGRLACWGYDDYGQVSGPNASTDTYTAVETGLYSVCAVRTDRRLACWGRDHLQSVSGPNGSTESYVDVSGGWNHTCALRSDNRLACWGYNSAGQVSGPNLSTATYSAVGVGVFHTCALRSDGRLACWGALGDEVSGPNGSAASYLSMDAERYITCAVRDDRRLVCWGRNDYGRVSGPNGDPGTFGPDSPVCTALDSCHVPGVCDPATGSCTNPIAQNGVPCNDGNLCTTIDTCQTGVCTGSSSVVCTPSDQCHVAGTCDPANGQCSNPPANNGTSCNDGSLCTQPDTCQGGTCTGTNSVVCTASDQCHVAGICNPTNGQCSDPPANNGTSCNDGSACTQLDTCQTGTCTGMNPVVCTPIDQCHLAGTCDNLTGTCSNPPKANDSPCNDGITCTSPDTCQAGICRGAPPATCEVQPGQGVTFQQVDFTFPGAPLANSRWGRLEIDVAQVRTQTGMDSLPVGFLNVVTNAGRVVENVRPGNTDKLTVYFDLGNTTGVDVSTLSAHVEYSLNIPTNAPNTPRRNYSVGNAAYNADGPGAMRAQPPGAGVPPSTNIPIQGPTTDAVFGLQSEYNVEASVEQSFPMSAASSLKDLAARYPTVLTLPHPHAPGGNGDNTLVGQLDQRSGRAPGATLGWRQMVDGKFAYLAANGLGSKLVYRHKGYGTGASRLPTGNYQRSGVVSRDETKVDYFAPISLRWLLQALSRGENVELTWINPDGQSGQAVRVVAAGWTAGKWWVRYVHDRRQEGLAGGTGSEGLETVEAKAYFDIGGNLYIDGKLITFIQAAAVKGVVPSMTTPPDRDGNFVPETTCPPVSTGGTKLTPHATYGDADKDANGVLDYIMGEWAFIDVDSAGTHELKVRKWCMNRPASGGRFNDYLTFEIVTGENGAFSTAVAANNENLSPFAGGKNLTFGFENLKLVTTSLPKRIESISGNPQPLNLQSDRLKKTIYVEAPGTRQWFKGTITRTLAGQFTLTGTFAAADGTLKASADLTAEDRTLILGEFAVSRAALNRVYGTNFLLPGLGSGATESALGTEIPNNDDVDEDGVPNGGDNCPTLANLAQEDADDDGEGDVCDCAPADPDLASAPGEIMFDGFPIDKELYSWPPPDHLGSFNVTYDVIRSTSASDFSDATCLATDSTETEVVDPTVPESGGVFYYMVAARNACGSGNFGTNSAEAPRPGRSCP